MGMHEIGKHALYLTGMFATHAMIINADSWDSLPTDIQDMILNEVMPEIYEFFKESYREDDEAAIELINQSVETAHWVTAEEAHDYQEFCLASPIIKTMMLYVDPRIIEIVEELRPSSQ
jgi:TRAP-type C4-dicarboxylate transport system substrate-binding protein